MKILVSLANILDKKVDSADESPQNAQNALFRGSAPFVKEQQRDQAEDAAPQDHADLKPAAAREFMPPCETHLPAMPETEAALVQFLTTEPVRKMYPTTPPMCVSSRASPCTVPLRTWQSERIPELIPAMAP